MTHVRMMALGLVIVALGAGCNDSTSKTKPTSSTGHDAGHVHGPGPHDGTIFDLGKYHAEFTVDHGKKECTLYILGADEQTATPIMAKDLVLSTKATKTEDGKAVPAMTIKLTAKDEKDGKASIFVGSDPGLGMVADFEGTVTGVIDDKPAKGSFKEEEHDHDHDKK